MKRTRQSRPSTTPKIPKAKRAKVREMLDPVESKPASGTVVTESTTPDVDAPHPLLINEVVKNLFGYLVESDLRSCRLVHPTWNVEALPHLKKRSNSFLHIRTYPQLISFNYATHFRELRRFIQRSTDFPFVKEVYLSVHSDVQVFGPAWRELMEVVAEHVTELTILVRDYLSPYIPKGIEFSKVTTLRVLKETKKRIFDRSDLTSMLGCFPNLKILDFVQDADADSD